MRLCVAGQPASCQGHTQTGSSVVTIEGRGVCRVETDTAGGLIIGPGSQNIFIEGMKASLEGDTITSHGKSPHSRAVTVAGQQKVFGGTGFRGDQNSTGYAPKPDLIVESFSVSVSDLHCSGQGTYPPANINAAYNFCNQGPGGGGFTGGGPESVPEVVYSYTIKNVGRDTAQPFTVGFWRFSDLTQIPSRAIVTVNSTGFYPGVSLEGQQEFGALNPEQTVSGEFRFASPYYASARRYAFGIYADILSETTEPSEDNSSQVVVIPIDNECR